MSTQQIALVTGANRGIGHEVARQLWTRGFQVFLGARSASAGKEAAKKIGARFLAIDVADDASVAQAASELGRTVEHLDVLVNNAGVIEDGDDSVTDLSTALAMRTLNTNTLGPLRVTRAFLPLLRKSKAPRIINVSSGGGQLSEMGTWAPAYCISKTALNAVTLQLAGALPGFAVNSVCPGWVRTDMGGAGAPRSVAQGADTIVWLATEAPASLTGKFLRDREEIPW